jgi:N-formylglutamate deformylase
MQESYPLLISVPHGGDKIPSEVEGKLRLDINDLIEDSDAFTKTIYDIGNRARSVICADILRAVVDPNRAPDDLPPANPDGVVKSHTCYNKKIYKDEFHKDAQLIDTLLTRYYSEYHNRIKKEVLRDDIDIAFDCHSMASKAPEIAPDRGMDRPVINLGNNYGKSCDYATTEKLAGAFRHIFKLENYHVTINEPFAGGFITRIYGKRPVPWIQIEMNRCLYLDDRWFNPAGMEINANRLIVMNSRFKRVVEMFFEPGI